MQLFGITIRIVQIICVSIVRAFLDQHEYDRPPPAAISMKIAFGVQC
jgi:hypothetical protein